MNMGFKYVLAGIMVLWLNNVSINGQETGCKAKDADKSVQQTCEAKSVSELLAGVVQLSDDDIRFRTKGGICVFVDPVNGPDNKLAADSGMTKPDLILITHSHGDHFQPDVINAYLKINPDAIVAGPNDVFKAAKEKGISKVELVKPNQKYTIAGVNFNTVPAYFLDAKQGHPKTNQWVGYVLQLDGAKYFITGDTEPVPQMANLNPDVIFPLFYGCGGNMDNAIKMTYISKARVAVPVHFSSGTSDIDPRVIENVKKYTSTLNRVKSAYYLSGKLIVTQ